MHPSFVGHANEPASFSAEAAEFSYGNEDFMTWRDFITSGRTDVVRSYYSTGKFRRGKVKNDLMMVLIDAV